MLLFTPENARWRRWTLLACVPLIASYVWYARRQFPHGGSAMGLAYGFLATFLMLVLLFFAVRKRWHRSRLGTLQGWCQSHVWLGLLVLLVILFHTGFRFEDRVAVAAFVCMAGVSASGAVGAVLYTLVPWLLTGVENNLAPAEISKQLNQTAHVMARLASGKSPVLQRICQTLLAAARPGWLAGWRLLWRPPDRDARSADDAVWQRLLPEVAPAEQDDLKQLLILSRQYRELELALLAQQRYRNLLAVWLYVHIPLSVALVILVGAHLGGVLYYSAALETVLGQ
jgi:hypothetical protein